MAEFRRDIERMGAGRPHVRAVVAGPQARRLMSQMRTQGGFTHNPRTGLAVGEGISVSIPGHEETMPIEDMRGRHIRQYAGRHQTILSRPGHMLGGWRSQPEGFDSEHGFLDVSVVHPDTEEGRMGALRAMVSGNQFAGFNLKTFADIPNPYHPSWKAPGGLGSPDQEYRRALAGD